MYLVPYLAASQVPDKWHISKSISTRYLLGNYYYYVLFGLAETKAA